MTRGKKNSDETLLELHGAKWDAYLDRVWEETRAKFAGSVVPTPEQKQVIRDAFMQEHYAQRSAEYAALRQEKERKQAIKAAQTKARLDALVERRLLKLRGTKQYNPKGAT
jgi:hypothetical protein